MQGRRGADAGGPRHCYDGEVRWYPERGQGVRRPSASPGEHPEKHRPATWGWRGGGGWGGGGAAVQGWGGGGYRGEGGFLLGAMPAPPVLARGHQTRETPPPSTVKNCRRCSQAKLTDILDDDDLLPPTRAKMSGRDEQTDCRQQRNNTGLPPPEGEAQGAGSAPSGAEKKLHGENFGAELKTEVVP